MNKRFIPYAHAVSVFEIDPSFFQKENVEVLLIDLDNTLDSYKTKTPSQRTIDFVKKMHDANIKVIITSNNRGKRVSTYANALNVPYIANLKKPFAKKLNIFLSNNNFHKENVMMIGDQVLTDIGAGNGAGIKTILVEKLVKEDQFTTHFNRLLDTPMRKHLRKNNLLINWRDK